MEQVSLSQLLEYFYGRAHEEAGSKATEMSVDKEKLKALLEAIECHEIVRWVRQRRR
jgi:hypothetical protein